MGQATQEGRNTVRGAGVPREIAFESQPPGEASKLLRSLYYRGVEPADPLFRKRAG
jgi:hypothetical protein